MKISFWALSLVAGIFAVNSLPAQDTPVTSSTPSGAIVPPASTSSSNSATQAFNVAKDGVDPSLRSRVVSIYGTGTPAAINTWYVIFYDPSVASHGRAVRVENGQITRTYEAHSGVVYGDTLTFDPSRVTDERLALTAAQNYAAQHAIAYDHVRALLRLTSKDEGFRWRIQLLDDGTSKGFVFANATDGTFAMYEPAGSQPSSSSGGSVTGDVQHAANQVKNTFLGIGGDLQQFFTGERTVDQ